MKKILLIVCLAVANLLQAQRCKFFDVSEDHFENVVVRSIGGKLFAEGGTGGCNIIFNQRDTSTLVMLNYTTGDNSIFFIHDGDLLKIKLQNNTIIELKSVQREITRVLYEPSIRMNFTNIKPIYQASLAVLKKLEESPITYVKIYTSIGYIEQEVKEKHAQKIMGYAACAQMF